MAGVEDALVQAMGTKDRETIEAVRAKILATKVGDGVSINASSPYDVLDFKVTGDRDLLLQPHLNSVHCKAATMSHIMFDPKIGVGIDLGPKNMNSNFPTTKSDLLVCPKP